MNVNQIINYENTRFIESAEAVCEYCNQYKGNEHGEMCDKCYLAELKENFYNSYDISDYSDNR